MNASTIKSMQSRKCIALDRADEVRVWSRILGVKESELRTATRAVGPETAKVREYLMQIRRT